MKASLASPKVRDIADHLIAYEIAGENGAGVILPAYQICEKLRRPLSTLTGAAGFRSLLMRALVLTKHEANDFDAVQVKEDGTLEGLTCDAGRPGEVLLIAQLLGLLMTFIGDALTMHLLMEIWPELIGVELNSAGREEYD